MIQKKFVNCGFEFTASPKKKGIVISDVIYNNHGIDEHRLFKRYNPNGRKSTPSTYGWINDRYNTDSCGCEVSTPVVTSRQEVDTYFTQFKHFVDKINVTLDRDQAKCNLGGCHIHMSMPKISEIKQNLFLRNVAILMTNYPQLNWGFNDPNDNQNANSMLTEYPRKAIDKTNSALFDLIDFNVNNEWDYYDYDCGERTVKKSHWIYPFKDNNNVFKIFTHKPLHVGLNKEFAIRYNEYFKTVEFRIFDMPKTLDQHILHYDVANSIYNYCLDLTKKGEQIKPKYKTSSEFAKQGVRQAISEFYVVMDILNIDAKRTDEQVENIHSRYRWTKESRALAIKRKGKTHENYLL